MVVLVEDVDCSVCEYSLGMCQRLVFGCSLLGYS